MWGSGSSTHFANPAPGARGNTAAKGGRRNPRQQGEEVGGGAYGRLGGGCSSRRGGPRTEAELWRGGPWREASDGGGRRRREREVGWRPVTARALGRSAGNGEGHEVGLAAGGREVGRAVGGEVEWRRWKETGMERWGK